MNGCTIVLYSSGVSCTMIICCAEYWVRVSVPYYERERVMPTHLANVHVRGWVHDIDLDIGMFARGIDPSQHPSILLGTLLGAVHTETLVVHTIFVLSISCTSAKVLPRKNGAFAADRAVFSIRTTAGVIRLESSMSGKLPRRVKLCATGSWSKLSKHIPTRDNLGRTFVQDSLKTKTPQNLDILERRGTHL